MKRMNARLIDGYALWMGRTDSWLDGRKGGWMVDGWTEGWMEIVTKFGCVPIGDYGMFD